MELIEQQTNENEQSEIIGYDCNVLPKDYTAWNIITTGLPIILSIVTMIVTINQWRINKQNLRLNLYKRRYNIYEKCRNILKDIKFFGGEFCKVRYHKEATETMVAAAPEIFQKQSNKFNKQEAIKPIYNLKDLIGESEFIFEEDVIYLQKRQLEISNALVDIISLNNMIEKYILYEIDNCNKYPDEIGKGIMNIRNDVFYKIGKDVLDKLEKNDVKDFIDFSKGLEEEYKNKQSDIKCLGEYLYNLQLQLLNLLDEIDERYPKVFDPYLNFKYIKN
ncbi:hypothetical protein [Clostridium baratii]|uniref:hypothetical protein n=1 Tax=Clostridium baratii TaxID=1561 RepID=UPI001C229C34|nr:hypothetical protein [Clostridium baratii]